MNFAGFQCVISILRKKFSLCSLIGGESVAGFMGQYVYISGSSVEVRENKRAFLAGNIRTVSAGALPSLASTSKSSE